MAVMAHPEVYYSFRPIDRVVSPDRTDTRALASIETLLVSAADSYRARQYLDSISSYNAARSLIWSQLYPTRSLDEQKAAGVDLTRMLVSYGNEWLNVLPVEESVSGVRPREEVDLDAGPLLGLRSAKIDARATDAAADLEVAAALEDHGDAKAAEFFRDRARTLAGDLVDQISAQFPPAPQAGPAPVTPTPAPPLPPLVTPPVVAVPRGLTDHPFEPARSALAVGIVRDFSPAAFNVPDVVGTVPVVPIPDHLTVEQRSYVVPAAAGIAQVEWNEGDAPAVDDVVKAVYEIGRASCRERV